MLKLDPSDIPHETVSAFCPLPFHKVILTSPGGFVMCCHQGSSFGGIQDGEILDLWNGKLAQDIRERTTEGKLHEVCSHRKTCPFINGGKTMYNIPIYRNCKYPFVLEICLPDSHCNVGGTKPSSKNPACIMCRRNFVDVTDPNTITIEKLCDKAKPLMPYLRELMVLGTAEPFWKDAVFEVFQRLEFSYYKKQCRFATNTNAICLNEKTIRRFFEETLTTELSFSIDAATPMTYRKIRRLDMYEKVIDNISKYLVLRNDYVGSHKAIIYNNINLLNVHEMSQMVEVAAKLGVDGMIMLPTYTVDNSVKLGEFILCEKNVDIFKECSEEAMATAHRVGMPLRYTMRFDVALSDAHLAMSA